MSTITTDALPESSGASTSRLEERYWLDRTGALILPAFLFFLLFLIAPLAEILHRSFVDPSPAETYGVFLESNLYLRVLSNTFKNTIAVTLICLVIGYLYAYVAATAHGSIKAILLLLVVLPFWSSMLVRSYSWTVILQDSGLINSALTRLGLIEKPLPLIRTTFAAILGMVHVMLPFMVFSIYASIRRVPRELAPAAQTLGASPFKAFWLVVFPLTLPGVYAGAVIVFVMSLGFYITPALLGAPRDMMMGELIVNMVTRLRELGIGSALGIVLLTCVVGLLLVSSRFTNLSRSIGLTGDDDRA